MSNTQADQKFLIKSSMFTFLGSALKVISPVLMIVVARVFDKELFGIYVSTQLLMLMISRAAVLGLDKGLHWYIPQNGLQSRPLHEGIMESFWRAVFIATIMAVVGIACAHFGLHKYFSGLETLSSQEISLYLLSLIPWVMIHVLAGASEGNRRPQYKILINDFAVSAFAPVVALGLYTLGVRGYALPIGLLVSNIVGAILYLFIIHGQFPQMPWLPHKKVTRTLFRYAVPLGVSEVVISFLLRTDLWMVLVFLGPADAGVYAVMVTISNGLRTISQSFNPILLPVVAGMDGERLKTDLKPVYSYCVAMVTLIQLGIGFFIVLFPEETLMVAGKSFVMQPQVLGILLLGNLINGMFGLSGAAINGMGRSKFMMLLNAVTLIFALAMNVLLIPRLGLAGAALSTALYQTLQSVWTNIYLVKMGLWPYKKSLFVQGGWILLLFAVYLATSTVIHLELYQKIVGFALSVVGLLLTLFAQGLLGQKFSRKKASA